MKKVIGVTGGVGAGKSRVLGILRDEYGARVIYADRVAEELELPGGAANEALRAAFGSSFFREDNTLDKEAFSTLIFNDAKARETTDAIVHPLTVEKIRSLTAASEEGLTVVEAAVFPPELAALCDEVWLVDATEEARAKRLMKDRGYSPEKCADIMKSQAGRDEFLKIAGRVIDNNGSVEETEKQILKILGAPGNYRGAKCS